MEQQPDLFGNFKYCDICRRPLSLAYEKDLCPVCIEQELFHEVKEYIRENDVNEYDVAKEFNIPLHQVKRWIREGRIEYKEDHLNTIAMKCAKCGATISFGTFCSKCLRQHNSSGHSIGPVKDDSRMRFLDEKK